MRKRTPFENMMWKLDNIPIDYEGFLKKANEIRLRTRSGSEERAYADRVIEYARVNKVVEEYLDED